VATTKGNVEALLKFARHGFLTPLPDERSFAALNAALERLNSRRSVEVLAARFRRRDQSLARPARRCRQWPVGQIRALGPNAPRRGRARIQGNLHHPVKVEDMEGPRPRLPKILVIDVEQS
jgi:hypothetical protein